VGALVDGAAGFLGGPGHGLARRTLSALGLPADLDDDLVQEALIRALRAEERGVHVDNIEAFTTVVLQRAARDLSRGLRRRPEGHLVHEEPLDGPSVDDHPDAVVLDALDRDEVRERLGRELAGRARAVAGALAVFAVAVDGARPAADCPAPKAGAGEQEVLAWAGLFYGGRRDCFPRPGEADDDAIRKRRSRAVQEQRRALHDALVATTGEELLDG
jgi:hypothetical protein